MSQIYNDNTKRPKPNKNQQGILGISSGEFRHFAADSASGSGESAAGATYLSLSIYPKSCHTFPLKVAVTWLWEGWFREGYSWGIVVTY